MRKNMKYTWLFLILGVVIFGYGCATKQKIVLAYHPQENVTPMKEAGEIGIQVKAFDLRKNKANDLNSVVSNAIETELLNRGFKLGESVLIEIDLIKIRNFKKSEKGNLFEYIYNQLKKGQLLPKGYTQITFHVRVKNSKRVLVFQRLIKQRGDYSQMKHFVRWDNQFNRDSAFKAGIHWIINDPDFLNSLIEANLK
jgi:hypothetical protein